MVTLELSRTLPVSADEAYAAWTEPERMRRWWWPFFPDTVIDLDPQIGGDYQMTSLSAGIGARGTYLTVEPQELVFTWNWVTGGVPENSSDVVRVRFTSTADGCSVDLSHDLDPRAGDGEDLRQGWCDVLDSLVRYTAS